MKSHVKCFEWRLALFLIIHLEKSGRKDLLPHLSCPLNVPCCLGTITLIVMYFSTSSSEVGIIVPILQVSRPGLLVQGS